MYKACSYLLLAEAEFAKTVYLSQQWMQHGVSDYKLSNKERLMRWSNGIGLISWSLRTLKLII